MGAPKGRTKPVGSGRAKGTPNKSTLELREMVSAICGDPLEGMARLASGDVIALGYMTLRELKEPPTFDARGRVVRPSGMERALSYVPPGLRADMFKELSQYLYPKKRSMMLVDGEDNPLTGAGVGLMLYMPHNGREAADPKVMVKKKPEPK